MQVIWRHLAYNLAQWRGQKRARGQCGGSFGGLGACSSAAVVARARVTPVKKIKN
jgi:hypothetical protein